VSQLSEFKVTWAGDLIFSNHDTVASRLEGAERDNKLHAPQCNLDWSQVLVQTDFKEG